MKHAIPDAYKDHVDLNEAERLMEEWIWNRVNDNWIGGEIDGLNDFDSKSEAERRVEEITTRHVSEATSHAGQEMIRRADEKIAE